MSDIFIPKTSLKPVEYPIFLKYIRAIHDAFWTVHHYNFTKDIQDFKVSLTDVEREIIKRTMLAISTIEAKVKDFYGISIPQRFPKPEIQKMGSVFSDNEVRHEMAYSHLLEILGLNDAFEEIIKVPEISDRLGYLGKYKEWQNANKDSNFLKSLILFAVFIEGTSLMTQFIIMQSFKNYKNELIAINNVVQATSKEEVLHTLAAFDLINILRKEHPELFTEETEELVYTWTKKAYKAETKILDWIFEHGELDFLPKSILDDYLKHRLDWCITQIGYNPIFGAPALPPELEWFDVSLHSGRQNDFFNDRPTDYHLGNSYTEEDIF
jgi:ribonucleoside-diphosphate reductase beta chain